MTDTLRIAGLEEFHRLANLGLGRRVDHHPTPTSTVLAEDLKTLVEEHGIVIGSPGSGAPDIEDEALFLRLARRLAEPHQYDHPMVLKEAAVLRHLVVEHGCRLEDRSQA